MTKLLRRPEATGYSIERIVQEALDGRIRIPSFQRPLRWDKKHVVALFDSIKRGFPVGELLLARRPAKSDAFKIGTVEIRANESNEALWVVDGQQRLTALVAALARTEANPTKDMWALWYDLRNQVFEQHFSVPEGDHLIPLNVVLDSAKLMKWSARKLYEHGHEDLFEEAIQLGKAIREFQLPAYLVDGADETALRMIFTRINDSGVRMRESEVFDALLDSGERHPIRDSARQLSELGWGEVDPELMSRCLKLEFNSGDESVSSEKLVEKLPVDAIERLSTAFEISMRLLQDAGIPSFSLLPYRLPMIGLVLMAIRFGNASARAARLAKFWIWRGALSGATEKSSRAAAKAMFQKISRFRDWESCLDSLLAELPDVDLSEELPHDPRACLHQRIALRSASHRMFLCFLHHRIPTDDLGCNINAEVQKPPYASPWPQRPVVLLDAVHPSWNNEFINHSLLPMPSGIASFVLDGQCIVDLQNNDPVSFQKHRKALLVDELTEFLHHRIGAKDELRLGISALLEQDRNA